MPAASKKIPVTVVTGFLGSGKTTLINRLLRAPGLADTAVVINEFGEIGLDHHLVESAREDIVLLRNGCVCCSVRGDLVDTLADLRARAKSGDVPPFARAIVETTGLADPAPVLQTLLGDPAVTDDYELAGLVATIDALHWERQRAEHYQAAAQTALADRLLLTKTDMADAAGIARIEGRLRAANPSAEIVEVVHGAIEADVVLAAFACPRSPPNQTHAHHQHLHADDIRSFAARYDKPVQWEAFSQWLSSVISLRGADILRIKGLVDVVGLDRPVVVNGVHHVFHPPSTLGAWPAGDRSTRLVFITRGLDFSQLASALEAALT